MALPLLTRKRILAAKVETTPGEVIALAAADADYVIFDPIMQPNIDNEDRRGPGSFGSIPSVPGARGATLTFSLELMGSGAGGAPVPEWAPVFFPACGLIQESGDVFVPKSESPIGAGSDVKTLTIGLYEDGLLKRMRGCMGNCVFNFTNGMRVVLEFTFTGIWMPPTDVGLLAPTFPTVQPPRFADASLAIGGFVPKISTMTIDLNNEVVLREDANDISGFCNAVITDRSIGGSLDPEEKLVATDDNYGDWLSRAEQVLAITVGSVAGNIIDIAAPKLQFQNIQEADRNGIQASDLTFQCNRNASAGDDEITITFT